MPSKNNVEEFYKNKNKEDTSPHIHQRQKSKHHFELKDKIQWTEKQKQFIELALDKNVKALIIRGPAGSSKAQPLDAELITPNGPIRMGDIKIGDSVISVDGKPTKVIGIYPQGEKEIYKITFSDGSSTECCADHLWLTQTYEERNHHSKIKGKKFKNPQFGQIRTTLEIAETLIARGTHKNHSIPITNPVHFNEQYHLIDPYILGVLIGDGCLRNTITFSSADEEIVLKVQKLLPEQLTLPHRKKIDYRIIHKSHIELIKNGGHLFKNELKYLNLYGKYSYEKHIPKDYLYDSIENRLELLRGLMDTDGHVQSNSGSTYYTTTSEQLAKDIVFLVESLGGIVKMHKRENYFSYLGKKKKGRDSYSLCIQVRPDIQLFNLTRKLNKIIPKTKYFPIRYITNVEKIGIKKCQCILVEHPSHLYLTNNFIVTHNTLTSVFCALKLLQEKKVSDIIYARPAVESSDTKLGFLPGDLNEKIHFYNLPFFDKLDELLNKQDIDHLIKDERLSCFTVNFARGMSWNAKAIILDETQNFTIKEMITLLTRIGHFCKVFVLADPSQSDLTNGKCGAFEKVYELFNDKESKDNGIYTFEFDEEDIVRSEFTKFLVHKFKQLK